MARDANSTTRPKCRGRIRNVAAAHETGLAPLAQPRTGCRDCLQLCAGRCAKSKSVLSGGELRKKLEQGNRWHHLGCSGRGRNAKLSPPRLHRRNAPANQAGHIRIRPSTQKPLFAVCPFPPLGLWIQNTETWGLELRAT